MILATYSDSVVDEKQCKATSSRVPNKARAILCDKVCTSQSLRMPVTSCR